MSAPPRQGSVRVNGVDLFVDDRGDPAAPPLLFVHGGPGQSCWDFMAAQGDRLGRHLRIIGVDQRGVLRSGDLPPGEPLDVDVLVADFEALRDHLGIEAWTVLGHSAGGAYALRYATSRPGSVRAAVFDCPCWDCDLTDRYRLPVVAARLDARGEHEAAAAVRRLAEKPERITATDEPWVLMQKLGDAYLDLFFSRSESARTFEARTASAGFADDAWARGGSHLPLLAAMYEPQLHLLDELAVPSLLLHGADDLVLPPVVIAEYRRRVPNGSMHTFEGSGHFACSEEPDTYADVVTDFVVRHSGAPSLDS